MHFYAIARLKKPHSECLPCVPAGRELPPVARAERSLRIAKRGARGPLDGCMFSIKALTAEWAMCCGRRMSFSGFSTAPSCPSSINPDYPSVYLTPLLRPPRTISRNGSAFTFRWWGEGFGYSFRAGRAGRWSMDRFGYAQNKSKPQIPRRATVCQPAGSKHSHLTAH